ncbi:hypothetical protein [Pedobacter sp. L105]|uniref:hypothetical protein n=1 Tax=Pedobacter sp. L105 TaxID=1641871 RepID=UPI00131B70E8|nr:hypothetical protein [Pedobacter sp. L105]
MKIEGVNKGQIFSRKELKNIRGGDGGIPPAVPTGTACVNRKCCLTPGNCSACVCLCSAGTCATGTVTTC